ncbi:MAG: Ig-like domain-containing protein [Bacteroidales bacterium]|nr:Ig-like domain-containing protein [Bacteroidales bacterium]
MSGLLVALIVLLAACAKEPASIQVSPATLSLTEGETATISAKVLPEDARYDGISWSSSNTGVATVQNGLVKAVAPGNATITAKAGEVSGTASVAVKAKIIPVTGVSLDKTSLTLTEGDTQTLKATVAPDNASDKSVTWTSSAPTVATVDDTGKVTAVKAGEATITVKTKDGGKQATCALTVNAKVVAVTGVRLDQTELSLYPEESVTLVATVEPENATDKLVFWTSSNSAVANVNGSGLVMALAEGSAVITATTHDGSKTATCQVTVKKKIVHVTGVTIENWGLSLLVNETGQINYTVKPADATDKSVTFESSNPAVATVSSTGLVKAVGTGEARVTVTTTDGGFTAFCNVKVSEQVGLFEVDGIAYKVMRNRQVEVTSRDPKYSGTVNVPATVTYQGVEYSVYKIGLRAFYECPELVSVNVGEGISYIDALAFSFNPLLESIVLPASFNDFDASNPVFSYVPKLEISVSPDNPKWFVKDHALYQKDSSTNLILRWMPEKLTGTFAVMEGTTSLHDFSIYHTFIDKLVVPKTVNKICVRFFNSSKTPLVIELYWTTKEEVEAIKTNEPNPDLFFFRYTDRSEVTVTVPKGTKALYEAHWLWSVLGGITERDQ